MDSDNNKKDYVQRKRKTEIGKGYQDSRVNCDSRSLGNASGSCQEIGDNAVGASRETSERRDRSRSSIGRKILGGTISQLIAKAEDQLAVLESSANETRKYISDLKELESVMKKII